MIEELSFVIFFFFITCLRSVDRLDGISKHERTQSVGNVVVYFFLDSYSYSWQGDRDSEICLVVEDDDMVQSTMDGQPYEVSRFATTLRRRLYRGV